MINGRIHPQFTYFNINCNSKLALEKLQLCLLAKYFCEKYVLNNANKIKPKQSQLSQN